MQINRLFEIVYLLMDRSKVTAKELAERFDVSTRTIYRDVDSLSLSGIPIYMTKGKNGGISLLPNYVLNKAVLTEEEKKDILSSLHALNVISFNETDSALKKLSSLFGDSNYDWIEVDFSYWYNADIEYEKFNNIKAAIISRKSIEFRYSSVKGESTVRKVNPLKLYFKGMGRYLYAYCTLRNDYRFFKLSRIKDIQITDNFFEIKDPIYILKQDNVFEDEYVTLKLKLLPSLAFRVYDEFESYNCDKDGNFIVQISYPKGEWLFPYIASFGSGCEVLEPEHIRIFIKNELEKILEFYL